MRAIKFSNRSILLPGDDKLYIDLSFYQELQDRFKAPGDFAMAYVIAHKVGHHVQNILGTSQKVMSQRGRVSEEEFNTYMVRLELQADFYAGVWAHHAQRLHNILEEGDIEEAMNAASAVGDDRIQKQTRGYVLCDAITHGTSAKGSDGSTRVSQTAISTGRHLCGKGSARWAIKIGCSRLETG